MGRGLAAILPESNAGGPELRELEVTQIEPNPDQPRAKFDAAGLDALAGSIGSVGLLQPLIVPAGTYVGVGEDVETVGVSVLMTCRRDLDEALVYRLTQLLFTELPNIAESVSAARLIDAEQAPTTPIPLHPGAARYYREREITQ